MIQAKKVPMFIQPVYCRYFNPEVFASESKECDEWDDISNFDHALI